MAVSPLLRPVLGAALAALCSFGVAAQPAIARVTPAAASPGDLVIITGTGLDQVQTVRFFAVVGGFVGSWTVNMTPQTASPTRLTVLVPTMAGFAPPGAAPPGDPHGTITVVSGAGNDTAPFFFLQGTFIETAPFSYESPQTSTLGTGTTQSSGEKAVTTFDVAGGPPASGNTNFVLELENALPGTGAVPLLGIAATPPFPMIGDGTLVLAPPLIALPALTTDANGDAALPLPIPSFPYLGATLAWQWAFVDPALPGSVALAQGLSFRL